MGENLKYYDAGNTGHKMEEHYAHMMLSHLYTALGYIEDEADFLDDNTVSRNYWQDPAVGTYQTFDQTEFFVGADWTSKDFSGRENDGHIYIPTQCKDGTTTCKIHFGLHGCGGRAEGLANTYANLGALNDIIMVFPDTRCWNNNGDFDDENESKNYLKQTGILPAGFKAMVERVTSSITDPDDGDNDGDDAFDVEQCKDDAAATLAEDLE